MTTDHPCGTEECQRADLMHHYRDAEGRVFFVAGYDCYDPPWATFTRFGAQGRRVRRHAVPELPLRKTCEEAASDLNQYAADRGWVDVCQGCK
jgi:hypothetical protein